MKTLFVAEFLCGGGMFDTPVERIPKSLFCEGAAMWRALIDDLSAWGNVVTPIDPRLSLTLPNRNVTAVPMPLDALPWHDWIDAAKRSDAAVLIVPETDHLLIQAVTQLRAAGIEVLAVSNAALRLTSDKWQTAKWLHREGIPHPETWAIEPDSHLPVRSHPRSTLARLVTDGFVVKPRDGCGALDMRSYTDLDQALRSMSPHEITQRWVVGQPASVSIVACQADHCCTFLPAVWQNIRSNHDEMAESCLSYQGGSGPVSHEFQLRAQALATRVIESMPGKPAGFVGMDWIAGNDPAQDCVIEINPRLTTSYVGIRRMVSENITQRLFAIQNHPIALDVQCESITWDINSMAPSQEVDDCFGP
ncbi:ATP-grasp domain-containing protein [Neorhodopirellula pilleata]|uniref:Carbamoyl phosphate synthase-like protein n=1 Tax=Neorhodopirellula pilleata TaxID=2714738 RepID=A0A5C6AQ76_9BACT|nr:ATP-grasp domain-containing protein [Neorhodopirellula pilleata]TWU02105.1 carbamoyl phosphate synthase-like protein [Neorhodopirellula pilleata]